MADTIRTLSAMAEAARAAAEYDECEHGVPGGNDCVECMKRAHADEIRALNEEADAQADDFAALRLALRLPADAPFADVLTRARRWAELYDEDDGATVDEVAGV